MKYSLMASSSVLLFSLTVSFKKSPKKLGLFHNYGV